MYLTLPSIAFNKKGSYIKLIKTVKTKCMSSIREFKADIKSLCDNVQNECYVELMFGVSNEIELVWSVMVRCEKLKVETLHKINSKEPKKLSKKERREHYKKLVDDFYSQTIELIEDLNSIIP